MVEVGTQLVLDAEAALLELGAVNDNIGAADLNVTVMVSELVLVLLVSE